VLTPSDAVVAQIDAHLRAHPDAMLMEVARMFRVPELTVLHRIGAPRAVALDAARWDELLRALPVLGPLRVLVSSSGATMESRGTFGGFSLTGEYFNVQTSELDLHLRWTSIAYAVALEKPSHQSRRPTASVQFFDADGAAILKIFLLFGEREDDSDERRQAFAAIRARFALATEVASE
jgi:putative heme iron utilization protein